eukprot:COSAG06_NODE_9808_length_1811_cov_2.467874_3_plen_99_part_00
MCSAAYVVSPTRYAHRAFLLHDRRRWFGLKPDCAALNALDMMWTLVDLDGNGTVDIEEFLRLRWVIRKRLDDPGMKMGDALRLLNEFNATSQTTLRGS